MSQVNKELKVMTVGGHSFVVGKNSRTGTTATGSSNTKAPGFATSSGNTKSLRFRISAKNLANMDTVGSTDPYVKLYAQHEDSWVLIGQSEVHKNELNPSWAFEFEDKPFSRSGNQFWKIEVWDHDQVGTDDFVGETIVSIDAFYKDSADHTTVPLSTQGTLTLSKAISILV